MTDKNWEVMNDVQEAFDQITTFNFLLEQLQEAVNENHPKKIIDEANKAERELGLSSRAREQARNLNRNADKPIFYKNSQMGKSSDSILNKAHKRMTAKRQASHKAGRKVEKANKAL